VVKAQITPCSAAHAPWRFKRWFGFSRIRTSWNEISYRRGFDHVFSNDPIATKRYPSATFLPLAAPLPDGNAESDNRELDFIFVGSGWPNRFEPLRQIASVIPQARRRIVVTENPYIRGLKPWNEITGREVEPLAFQALQRISMDAKLTIALGRNFSGSPSAQTDGALPGPRLFENAAAGVVQLVSRELYPRCFDLFADQAELIGYDTDSELVSLVPQLLRDPDRLRNVREAALRRVKADHTYDRRVEEILQRIDSTQSDLQPLSSSSAAARIGRRKRTLHIAHNVVSNGHFGGAEIVLDELVKHGQTNDLILTHQDQGSWGKHYALLTAHGEPLEQFSLNQRLTQEDLRHQEMEMLIQGVLQKHEITHVNINHFLGFPPTITSIAKDSGCTVTFIAHDYFAVCDRFTLLNYREAFCDITSTCEAICDICRFRTEGLSFGSVRRRRESFAAALINVDRTFVGSDDARIRMQDLLGIPDDGIEVLSPPVPIAEAPVPTAETPGRSPLNQTVRRDSTHIAVLGNFTAQKGADVVLAVAERLKGTNVRFLIFGRIDAAYMERVQALSPIVEDCGTYAPGELPARLHECRFALFAPIWPETYCIALTEAQREGLIIHGETGLTFEPGDVDGLLNIVRQAPKYPPFLPEREASSEIRFHTPVTYAQAFHERVQDLTFEYAAPAVRNTGIDGVWAYRHTGPLTSSLGMASLPGRKGRFGSFALSDLRTLPQRSLKVYQRYGRQYAWRAATQYVREGLRR
jgi:glycosyltransferase involved in cell wall biosynthesis